MNWFKETNKRLRKMSLCNIALKIVPIPLGIITAKLMSEAVSHAIGGNISGVLTVGCALMAVVLGEKIFDILTGISYKKAETKALHECKINLFKQFLSAPLHILYSSDHGDALEKFDNDFDTVTKKTLSLYPNCTVGLLTAAAYFVFLSAQNIWIGITLAAVSTVQIIQPLVFEKISQVNYDSYRNIEAKMTDYTHSAYHGFETIKLYGLKNWYTERMKTLHKTYYKVCNKFEAINQTEISAEQLTSSILTYGTYGIIGLFILFDIAPMEVGISAIALSNSFYGAVKKAFDVIPKIAVAKTAEKRLSSWFMYDSADGKTVSETKIVLKNVSFAYGDKKILDNASVIFDCKKINILRGTNGIGKSTLFKLVTGLETASSGEITVGDIAPKELSAENFPRKIFYLPQDDAKFSCTAKELYSSLFEDMSKITALTERFGLTDKQLEETAIKDLSGGERKKVFLSLAFAIAPQILLLDEPTNSLDEEGKNLLKELLKKRTDGAVIITHESIFDDIAEENYVLRNGGFANE